jgi:hypothetical protein
MAGEVCVLTSVSDPTLAHIIKGSLEAEGMPVVLRGGGDAAPWSFGGMTGAFASDVHVLECDLDRLPLVADASISAGNHRRR